MRKLFAFVLAFLVSVSVYAETIPGIFRGRIGRTPFETASTIPPVLGGGLVSCLAKFVEPHRVAASNICEESGGISMYASSMWLRGEMIVGGALDVRGYGFIFRGLSAGSFFSITNKVSFTSLPMVTRIEAGMEPWLVDTVPVQSNENMIEWIGSGTFAADGTAVMVFPKWFIAVVDTGNGGYQVQLTANEDGLGDLSKTKQTTFFVARNSSKKSGSFDFRVTGIRKGFEAGLGTLSQEVTASEIKFREMQEK